MVKDGLDYYVIPTEDPHQSEYVASSDKRREWISGFAGSAGQAIVSKTAAYLVTDSRYWWQAREELDSNWYLIPAGAVDRPKDWIDFLVDRAKDSKIGVDARMISHEKATQLIAKLNTKGSKLVFPPQNFIDLSWKDKPLRSKDPIFIQSLDFTGQDASSRLTQVRQWIRAQPPAVPTYSKSPPTAAQKHVGTLITSLSSIAYLLNLRGSDIPFNPLFYSYLFISADKVILFLDAVKLTDDTEDYLRSLKVERREYNDIWPFLRRREWGEGKLLISPESSYAISLMLTHFRYTVVPSHVNNMKAVKNEVELEGLRSLDPMTSSDILLKRSIEMIELDPSSHKGYEEKHAALHSMGRYGEAFEAFKMMLLVLKQSPEPRLRDLRHQYIDATTTIKKVVEQTIRHVPHFLVDTVTGRLYDKTRQAAAFEELPIYDELRSSMTTQLDRPRIRSEVKKFYSYVMLSHRWQPNEPTFQMVENISIYGLPASPANDKVHWFCELVRSLRFRWAWSDTCCVNQLDKGVQQESLVAMFRWYRGSSLTVVHLLGVFSDSQETDCLWRSIWNTRGWTFQEYVASEVVQFYTEDWEPYLGFDIFNHKESPIILQEMERAMKFTTQELAILQPGLDKTREKLYLASMRQTTREEDIAYSLFGIFNVALPVIYGEGNQAIGRLLEHILTRSDNVTLLAWTGNSGRNHSYLPTDLTAYNQIVPPHVPPPVETIEMDDMIATLQSSSFDHSVAIALYDLLYVLPPLSLVAGRLRLPGIVFPLSNPVLFLESDPDSDLPVYHATSPMLGEVEIKTTEKLSGMRSLLLIHPWISPLLDYDFLFGSPLYDHVTRALQLVVRLRQPFGALLLAPLGRVQFKRVATDSLIMVRVSEETLLSELMDGIRTIDIQ